MWGRIAASTIAAISSISRAAPYEDVLSSFAEKPDNMLSVRHALDLLEHGVSTQFDGKRWRRRRGKFHTEPPAWSGSKAFQGTDFARCSECRASAIGSTTGKIEENTRHAAIALAPGGDVTASTPLMFATHKDVLKSQHMSTQVAWAQLDALSRWRYQQEHPSTTHSDMEDALARERLYGMRSADVGIPSKLTTSSLPEVAKVAMVPQQHRQQQQPQEHVQQHQERQTHQQHSQTHIQEQSKPGADRDVAQAQRPDRCGPEGTGSFAERWERLRQLASLQNSLSGASSVHSDRRWGLQLGRKQISAFEEAEEALAKANSQSRVHEAAVFLEVPTGASAMQARHLARKEMLGTLTEAPDDDQMVVFIKSAIEEVGGQILDEGRLRRIAPFYSGTKGFKSLSSLMEELSVVASSEDSWLQLPDKTRFKALQLGFGPAHFPKHVGQVASLTDQGYQAVLWAKRPQEMVDFIQRAIAEEGLEVVHEGGLSGLVPFHSGECATRSYSELLEELREVSKMEGSWLRHASKNQ